MFDFVTCLAHHCCKHDYRSWVNLQLDDAFDHLIKYLLSGILSLLLFLCFLWGKKLSKTTRTSLWPFLTSTSVPFLALPSNFEILVDKYNFIFCFHLRCCASLLRSANLGINTVETRCKTKMISKLTTLRLKRMSFQIRGYRLFILECEYDFPKDENSL